MFLHWIKNNTYGDDYVGTTEKDMKLGELISQRRKLLKISSLKLAEMVGISHTEIYRIEKGERQAPSIKILSEIAKVLGIPSGKILTYAGFEFPENIYTDAVFFPKLNDVQRLYLEKIADQMMAYDVMDDEKYDGLLKQVDMYLNYVQMKSREAGESDNG